MAIKFTQYLRPNGTPVAVEVSRQDAVEDMARQLAMAGVRFESEVLSTGEVSLTAEDDTVDESGPLAHEISPNGPAVLLAVDRLVLAAFSEIRVRDSNFVGKTEIP